MQLVSQKQYSRHSKFLEARTYFCNAFEERVSIKAPFSGFAQGGIKGII